MSTNSNPSERKVKRIWNLRMNLDEFNAINASLLDGAECELAWRGLAAGMNGAAMRSDAPVAWVKGFELGASMRQEADDYRERMRELGSAGGSAKAANTTPKDDNTTLDLACATPCATPDAIACGMGNPLPNPQSTILSLKSTPLPPKRGKRSRGEIILSYGEETKEVVNTLLEEWPEIDGANRKIQIQVDMFGSRVQDILTTQREITPEILIGAARMYLREGNNWMMAPQFFFGPGKSKTETPRWLMYVRGYMRTQNA